MGTGLDRVHEDGGAFAGGSGEFTRLREASAQVTHIGLGAGQDDIERSYPGFPLAKQAACEGVEFIKPSAQVPPHVEALAIR